MWDYIENSSISSFIFLRINLLSSEKDIYFLEILIILYLEEFYSIKKNYSEHVYIRDMSHKMLLKSIEPYDADGDKLTIET